jgi:hypothetical protein
MEFRLDDAVPVLERTPGTLRAMLTGLPEPWLRHNEGGETWSPFEVVGHLISGEESDWIPRAKIILAGGPNPVFPPFDRLRHLTAYASMGLAERLDRFEAARRESLATLRGFELTPAHLAMTGIHPEFGRVTLAQHLSTWTVHDLTHLAQIVRVMAKQYGEAVGPWTKYLSVLQG